MHTEEIYLIKKQLPLCYTRQQFKFVKNLSDLPKSEPFVYLTKITAATWSFKRIIPVYITLLERLLYIKKPERTGTYVTIHKKKALRLC